MTGRTVLRTARLEIFPVTRRELALLIDDIRLLEEDLELVRGTETFGADFILAMRWLELQHDGRTGDSPWLTYWQIVDTASRQGIGGACFKGPPDGEGNVEIGYGILPGFARQGYMTEAIGALCSWALTQPGVERILAETESGNTASHRVLSNCGFIPAGQEGDILSWRLEGTESPRR